jgi:nitroimidazol reductase NimA-like FMN-containing flavoprotein (pyridoxamine 5'-phosphate oxidase superfamily)
MLKKIATLVQTQRHCVLATCGLEGATCAPHSSLMAFCAAPDCGEFWLATLPQTRKWRNLAANPQASLLLTNLPEDDRDADGGEPGLALTVAARAEPFASLADEAEARRRLLAKHPQLASFLALETVAMLRLKAVSFQLLNGPTDVFFIEAEKMLDARARRA